MQYVVVKVKRDTNTVHHKVVPAWEVPVLEFIFEEGNIEHTDEREDAPGKEYPEAGFEFDRLTRAYGADPQSGVAYVASVYGQAGAGIRALKAAIAAAREDDKANPIEAIPAPVPAKRARRSAASQDALLG